MENLFLECFAAIPLELYKEVATLAYHVVQALIA